MKGNRVVGGIKGVFSGGEFYQQVRTVSGSIQNIVTQRIFNYYLDVADVFGRGTRCLSQLSQLSQFKRQWP